MRSTLALDEAATVAADAEPEAYPNLGFELSFSEKSESNFSKSFASIPSNLSSSSDDIGLRICYSCMEDDFEFFDPTVVL